MAAPKAQDMSVRDEDTLAQDQSLDRLQASMKKTLGFDGGPTGLVHMDTSELHQFMGELGEKMAQHDRLVVSPPWLEHLQAKLGALEGEVYGARLGALLKEVDPAYALEPEAEELVLKMADEFVHQVTKRAAEYAKHRRSGTLDAVDVQLCLEKHWDIVVPGIPARTAPRPAALAAPYTYRRVDPRAPAPPLVAEDRPRKGSKRPRAS